MNVLRFVASGLLPVIFALPVCAQQPSTAAQPMPPPLVGTIERHAGWPAAKNAGDVDTVDHLMAALYDVISGPMGKQREWERFRSLFLPDGRLGRIIAGG